jgi:hypothetical protein
MKRKTAWISLSLLGAAYFGWALFRVSDRVLFFDLAWPRGWPYPDCWLYELDVAFDRMNPAPPDNIKLHGELARVRLFVFSILLTFLSVASWGLKDFLPTRPHHGGR